MPPSTQNIVPSEIFWKQCLNGAVLPTPLPLDKSSLKTEGNVVDYLVQSVPLSDALATKLDHFANAHQLEPSILIQGMLAILLSRYSGEEVVVFGLRTSAQSVVEIGAHVLPLGISVSAEALVLPWLKELQTQWETLKLHQQTPLAQIREWAEVPINTPLFEVLLTITEDMSAEDLICPDEAHCAVILSAQIGQGIKQLRVQYDRNLFQDAAITRLVGHLQTLLESMVASPDQRLDKLSLLKQSERHQLLVEWNATQAHYPCDKAIHEVFAEQAKRTPNAIALIFPSLGTSPRIQLTYQELDRRANHLAHQLQQMGVGIETFVAISMERSIEMIVAILAILKAGGVYVPLDPAYPQERLEFMLEDTQAPILLTQSHLSDRLPASSAQVMCLDHNWGANLESPAVPLPCSVTSHNLAYINYTSGSTGRPKGVAIPHRAVLRLVFGTNFTQLDNAQTLLQLAPISFDAATLEIWGALLHGGRCVLFPGNGIPDPKDLGTVIRNEHVSTLWLTAALFNAIITEAPDALLGVKELLTGGEALSPAHIRQAQQQLPGTQLINGYGPTENTTFTCCYRIPCPLEAQIASIPIGKPIANTQAYVLDASLQPVPIGIPGELYIGGDGLAREYINRPDLTQERFIPHPFSSNAADRLYKTGDLVRYLPDGTIEFIGRRDNQVKIRGYRIELGEIETVLGQHQTVRDAVVIVREDIPGDKRLVAYVTPKAEQLPNVSQLKDYLHQQLAEYMVPGTIMVLDKIPLTANGKADRRALPVPANQGSGSAFIAPHTPIEQELAAIWGEILGVAQVGIEDNFFDLGGTSILSLQMAARVQKHFGSHFRAVKVYQYPTIRTLAQYLNQENNRQPTVQRPPGLAIQPNSGQSVPSALAGGVAMIGMTGRFPGARNIEELWHNLCAGVDSNTFFTDTELDPSIEPELRSDPHYVRARGIVEGAELFDAAFFGISPREAEVMDPQARVFLELAYEALETAGYTPENYDGLIGLYAGSGQNTYFEKHLCGRPDIINRLGEFQTMLANEKDFVTTRTSYKLSLTGPSLSINTACSTSLVATIQAFQSLMNRQCDIALAGGVSITTPQNRGYLYQEGSMLSPDGRCRPFDANAQGTLFNSGAGIVVLKRLEDALEDGDRIYAVIRGVGMNNDGADKVSFTAPSVNGQAEAIAMAHASCGFDPATITYIETHGTATPLGDPIEIEALTQAFRLRTDAKQFCAIGSIKSNIGHVVAAAGVAGLAKTALALYHRQIPASLNFKSPNPQIDFENSPFYVNHQLRDWSAGDAPRRAGVSSFGVGGTNAHVILEEAPAIPPSSPSRPIQLLLLSAKTSTALEQATRNLKTYLQQNPQVNLADMAYTLQQGRKGLNHRRAVICQNADEAIVALEALDVNHTATRLTDIRNPDVVFMFPGQGSQYVSMGANLYEHESVFQSAIDQCSDILKPILGQDIREILYPKTGESEAAAALLKQTQFTQPALFMVEYALAQLWQSWGIQPAAMIGHSIGEFVAACLAGVFSLDDALMLIATRGRMMGELPGGSMLSVRLPADEVVKRLNGAMAIAAINGPSLCVVSGPTDLVETLQRELEAEEVICKSLHTSHAFHSPMMDPIIEPFAALIQSIQLSPPQIPFISTVTTRWITVEQATDPLYWANHLRATVRFAEGVQTLWQQPQRVLLEVGPRTTAATLARQQAKDLKRQIAISSLGSTADHNAEWTAVLQALGQLWLAGVTIDWPAFYVDEYRHRLPLPTYPFERQRYWIDPKPAIKTESNQISSSPPSLPAASATVQPIEAQASHTQPTAQSQPRSMSEAPTPVMTDNRKQRLIPLLKETLETTSGLDIATADAETTFLEMGLDSLSLTQVALALKKQFKVKITFRNLLEDYPNLGTLSTFVDQSLPPEAFAAPPPSIPVPPPNPTEAPAASHTLAMFPNTGSNYAMNGHATQSEGVANAFNPPASGAIETLVAQQLQIMAQQLQLLGQAGVSMPSNIAPIAAPAPAEPSAPAAVAAPPVTTAPAALAQDEPQPRKSFGPGAKIEKSTSITLTSEQQTALDRMIERYIARTQKSKRQTQEHRKYLADPRTVSGFTPLFKEMVYPIVTDRAAGSKLWDVDGNEYVDITNGFGLNFFGWSPDFVTAAVKAQLDRGIEIGPQTPLAGKVAKLVAEFTGMERVAFCNTGSEAVMATLRLARTVTGRELVATFAGDYHGTFDEVLYRQGAKLKTLPAAPGILPSMFENLLVLDYNTPESLQILHDRADDLAAILVEPVRSRDPNLQPKEFLQDLRRLTAQSGTAFIFDEVVTGFRVHPGGAQAYFDIQADMATYGKVVGGGLPIGIVAGKAEYMDALDGGFWQYGDNSIPEVGVTFFAGTFVRHPMALAAAEAVLHKLKEGGPELQRSLAEKVHRFATYLNQYFKQIEAPIEIAHFSSFFYINYPHELPYANLLFYLLREKGIHVWDHRPCFFTLSHTDADIEFVVRAFKESVAEMQAVGFLPQPTIGTNSNGAGGFDRNHPPQFGARLGRDPEGNPAWYIPDPERPGKYLQLGSIA